MSANRDAKVQQIAELFSSGDYRVDPTAVAGTVIRRISVARPQPLSVSPPASMSVSPLTGGAGLAAGSPGLASGVRRRVIVSVDRGRARVASF